MDRVFEKRLKEKMRGLGFKTKGVLFIKPINDNLIATVSFGTWSSPIPKHLQVNPTIGIGNLEVNRLRFQLLERDGDPCWSTTTAILSYLLKCDFSKWDFIRGEVNEPMMDELLADVMKGGEMFWTKMSDSDNLLEYCKQHPEVAPILYYLRGEKEKGLQFMEDYVQRMSIPETDDEIVNKSIPYVPKEKTIIVRPDEDGKTMTWDELKEYFKKVPPGGQLVFPRKVGVDSSYLTFMKNYLELP